MCRPQLENILNIRFGEVESSFLVTFISRFHQVVDIPGNELGWSILSYVDEVLEGVMYSVQDFAVRLETNLHNSIDFVFELEQLHHHGRVFL